MKRDRLGWKNEVKGNTRSQTRKLIRPIHARVRQKGIENARVCTKRDSIDRESDRDVRDRCTVRRKSQLRGKVGDARREDARRLGKRRRMNWKNRLRRVEEDVDNDEDDGEDDNEDDDYGDYEGILNLRNLDCCFSKGRKNYKSKI